MTSTYAAPLPPNLARILRHHSAGTTPTRGRRGMTITIPMTAEPEAPTSPYDTDSDSPCDCPACCPSPTHSLSSAPSSPAESFDDDDNDDGEMFYPPPPSASARGWTRLAPAATKDGYAALTDDEVAPPTYDMSTGYDTVVDDWYTTTLSPVVEVDELPRLERVLAGPRTPVVTRPERMWSPVLERGVLEADAVETEGAEDGLLGGKKEARGVWGRLVGRLRRRSRVREM